MPKLLSTQQAAKLTKLKQTKIVRAIQRGHLPATKIGWVYVIDKEDLKKYVKAHAR